ncbi:esterase-like activity of phytase family protein [Aureibaculum sp. 2210JD6-5]|uniref:esterase-like activity of phytase family protein n=1 Tax=Aureibaculum sp. 2210JD6-5 TaxID=3103957 RepID=UPI002AACCA71|nr:esterase-like activity of phytase family protein [Aureibaculum sp. 2210JD6-5]MDY7396251.1 esterase-like activity of phytase family protein [Aureibaculum sp. 2210JD6-5]
MKRFLCILLLVSVLANCKSAKTPLKGKLQLKFLDEYIVPENIWIDSTLVGGLSGIDFANGKYYLVCDDASNPRYYEANIKINNSKIDTIVFTNVIKFNDSSQYLDLEAIRYDKNSSQVFITSEGSINYKKDPSFFSVKPDGTISHFFEIPGALKATSLEKPRNNGTLEGLSTSFDNKGYWIAMELPLEADGPEPTVTETKSPIRITYIDAKTRKPTRQFAYFLGKIDKTPKRNFAVNGLTDLMEYEKNKFIVVERSYSSGLGKQGNTIKIFKMDASKTTNCLALDSLKDFDFIPATKELLFDFESVKNQMTYKIIDNIEGITFGPTLANGNKSLLLVADNNFNKLGAQLNQFILLEILNN